MEEAPAGLKKSYIRGRRDGWLALLTLTLGQAKLSKSTGPQDSWSPGNWPRVDMQVIKKRAEERMTPWTMGPNLNLTFPIAPLSESSPSCACLPTQITHTALTYIYSTLIFFFQPLYHSLYLYRMWPCAIFTSKIISLKRNMHTMKVTHLNCKIQWFFWGVSKFKGQKWYGPNRSRRY